MGQNTFWQLETERATAVETEAGTWQVRFDVQARKKVYDSAGSQAGLAGIEPYHLLDWQERDGDDNIETVK